MIANAARPIAGDTESARWFLPGGYPPSVPNAPEATPRLRHPRLPDTLETLRLDGAKSLARGDVGVAIASDVEALGGWLRRNDLAEYQADFTPSLRIPCGDSVIHGAPGLTGGPTLARAVDTLSGAPGMEPSETPNTTFYVSAAHALRNAFSHRLQHMGDTIAVAAGSGDPSCTSHISIVDRDGMAVATTQTLLSAFGSAVTSRQTGVLLNNGVYWFDPRPGGPNSLGPGKRCLANMCPVVIAGADGSATALGASGGRRIIPAVLQACWFLIENGMNLEDALHYPRIDTNGQGLIADRRLDSATCAALARSFPVTRKSPAINPAWFANVTAAAWHQGTTTGCVEPSLPWGEAIAA